MKILSWNCRGLGNPRTIQSLGLLTKAKGPEVVFLMETKLWYKRAHLVAKKLNYEGCLVVEAIGRSGGLLLLWKQDVKVELLNYSQRHINVFITDEPGGSRWLLTYFYGNFEVSQRKGSFELLNSFKPTDMGWCVIGDYNEILTNDEKVGGRVRSEGQMDLFRQVLVKGSLFDLGWRGDKFTWSNRHEDESFTKERLDRVLANQQ